MIWHLSGTKSLPDICDHPLPCYSGDSELKDSKLSDVYNFLLVIMPPPLGTGGIMFSACPSVRPSEA